MEIKVLCIGCGRSGTKYFSKQFKNFGLSVGHEKGRLNGESNWMKTNLIFNKETKKLKQYTDIFHIIRNPIHQISSSSTIGKLAWEKIGKCISISKNDSEIIRSMKWWYYWNYKISKNPNYIDYILHIENFYEDIKPFLDKYKIKTYKKIHSLVNTRKHKNLTPKDLKIADKELYLKIIDLSSLYGYDI